MTNTKGFGNHLPVLIKLVSLTTGPILELGGGMFSTPFLHWACYPNRRLVTYDNEEMYFNTIKQYECDYHKVELVTDWDKVDVSGHWDIVLVDHHPNERRVEEVKRLVNTADYLVLHDTEGRWDGKYHYSTIYPLFKYRWDFSTGQRPFTTVLSNLKDLKGL
jgi:hypothetical protein